MSRNAKPAPPPQPPEKRPRDTRKQDFADKLMALLAQRNMSQADLARATGLGKDSISTYCRGQNLPSPKARQALADALGVAPGYFFQATVGETPEADGMMVDFRQVAGQPGRVWLKVNRSMSFATGAKIIALIEAEDAAK
jgi:transcriptional regulator with XRE-family HTH domain